MSCNCGCCSVGIDAARVGNRAGLSAVAYRTGTFATFRQELVDALSNVPELAGLSARVSDDYTITVIELWSAVADVITFYQERIANEAFLRTATQRDSLLRLARLIDYELASGAAATTRLAFALDAGTRALVPAGTRVQSVPAEGEKPQKFETLAPLWADARLNRLRIYPEAYIQSPTSQGRVDAIAAHDATGIANAAVLAAGDRVILFTPTDHEVLTVRDVKAKDEVLTVRWQAPIAGSAFEPSYGGDDPRYGAYRLGRSFHLFGFDAPEVVVVSALKTSDPTTAYLAQAMSNFEIHGDGTATNQISLDGRYPGLKPGATIALLATNPAWTQVIPFRVDAVSENVVKRTVTVGTSPVTSQTGTVSQLTLTPLTGLSLVDVVLDDVRAIVVHELVGESLRFWPYVFPATIRSGTVYVPGRRNGWSSIEVGRTVERGVYKAGTTLDLHDVPTGRAVLLVDDTGAAPVAARVAAAALVGLDVSFEPSPTDPGTVRVLGLAADQVATVTALVSGRLDAAVSIAAGPRELNVTLGGLAPQTITLPASLPAVASPDQIAAALQSAIRAALPVAPTFAQASVFVVRAHWIAIVAGVPGDRVEMGASANDSSTVAALGFDRTGWLDGVLSANVAVPATLSGSVVSRTGMFTASLGIAVRASTVTAIATAIQAQWGFGAAARDDGRLIVLPGASAREPWSLLRLTLELDSTVALDAATATLLGNVAPASHGETVRDEILGDGDAALAFQRFTLKKKPLTYVPAATPGGVASSLAVRVGGVGWREVPTLFGASPRDEVYVTRIADDGTTTVQFGDGRTGARPATGRQNITATYRQGVGLVGRVGARKITTLLDRPTGVKNVVNLVAADGGADPETIDRARRAAPGTVRTFGRAVSLRDFEDTALLAGEVVKATATWVWTGERRAIHLTIAGQGGTTFSADGLKRLAATLLAERDPNHMLLVDNYSPVGVVVDASIVVGDRYVTADVLAAARAALLAELDFEQRHFAQPVYLSDVFAALQRVEGVVAVDVNTLDLKSADSAFRAAHGIDPALGEPQPRVLMLPARPAGAGTVLAAELARVEVPAQDVIVRATGGVSP